MKSSQSPALTRFLSDFTLGFSDGLTVPFALTAGLSSLGQTNTVITGGLAELCAGSISMGIGGYLSARDELPSSSQNDEDSDDEELGGMLSGDEKASDESEETIRRYLDPLGLSEESLYDVFRTLQNKHGDLKRAALRLQSHCIATAASPEQQQPLPVSPIISGLSVSVGYAVGGIIPLMPYFVAATVARGLNWSICLCALALFSFGAGKEWALRGRTWGKLLWEGLQMTLLGMVAALAAVVCVRLVASETGED